MGGKKQDDDDVKRAGARLGLVVFEPYRRDQTGAPVRFRAMLVSADQAGQNVLPPLDHAFITRLDSRGILIRGQEIIARSPSIKSRLEYYDQLWLCKPA